MAKKRIKYLTPLMKFNLGTMSYEPDVNPEENEINKGIRIDWRSILIVIIVLILSMYLVVRFG